MDELRTALRLLSLLSLCNLHFLVVAPGLAGSGQGFSGQTAPWRRLGRAFHERGALGAVDLNRAALALGAAAIAMAIVLLTGNPSHRGEKRSAPHGTTN